MLNWFEKQKSSHRRAKKEQEGREASVEGLSTRESLAASVQELAVGAKAEQGVWSEEGEEEEEGEEPPSGGKTMLIPPRLSLQSRSFPALRKNTEVRELVESGELVARTDFQYSEPGRRLGRSTRVRLQAVQSGMEQEPVTESVASLEAKVLSPETSLVEQKAPIRRVDSPVPRRPIVARRVEARATTVPLTEESLVAVAPPVSLPFSVQYGSGLIEAGQTSATVHNVRVTSRSVITVMLTSNPGPVVVHYITLHHRSGFTLHLSAPVTERTPFNYAAWLF